MICESTQDPTWTLSTAKLGRGLLRPQQIGAAASAEELAASATEAAEGGDMKAARGFARGVDVLNKMAKGK